MEYVDFDLEIGTGTDGEYSVKARALGAVAKGTFHFPFDPSGGDALKTRLQALQIALLRSGGTPRRSATQESTAVEEFGRELWDAIFVGDVRARYEATRSAAGPGRGVRTRLSFETPELAALPWEFVFDPGRGDFMALSPGTPIVRFIEMDEVMEPLEVAPPLRILGMAVSPRDLPKLQIEREQELLTTALEPLRRRGIIELEWVSGRTRKDLHAALQEGPWHVFHFIGHGGYEEIQHEGSIFVENDDGGARRLSAKEIGLLLGARDSLRLAILNSCEGAKGDEVDVFSSTAATVVRKGTPAVIAMQFEITDDAAIEFSRSLYHAIGIGLPIDTALAEARLSVATEFSGTLEWGTPVLFMRSSDGVLFRIPKRAPEELDKLERDIQGARLAAEAAIAAKAAEEEAAEAAKVAQAAADKAAAEKALAEQAAADKAAADKALADQAAAAKLAAEQAAAAAAAKAAADKAAANKAERDRLIKRVALILAAAIGVVVLALVLLPRPDEPRLAASVAQAQSGELVSLSGSGFLPQETVTLWVGDSPLASVETDDHGAFVTSVTIPDMPAGSSAILAKDGAGNATQFAFEVLAADASEAPDPSTVIVPSVVGFSVADATTALEGACEPAPCFTIDVQEEEQDGADVDVVHGQSPEAGATGAPGDAVTIFVIPDEVDQPTPQPAEPLTVEATTEYSVQQDEWSVLLTVTPAGGVPDYVFDLNIETRTSDGSTVFELVGAGCDGLRAFGSVRSADGQSHDVDYTMRPHECDESPPSAPIAVSPPTETPIVVGTCDPQIVTLAWAPVEDAVGGARYAVLLEGSTDGSEWTTIDVPLTDGSAVDVSLGCGGYRWRVAAWDILGREGPPSDSQTFSVFTIDLPTFEIPDLPF
jgi:CHAT domain/PASTA domain